MITARVNAEVELTLHRLLFEVQPIVIIIKPKFTQKSVGSSNLVIEKCDGKTLFQRLYVRKRKQWRGKKQNQKGNPEQTQGLSHENYTIEQM